MGSSIRKRIPDSVQTWGTLVAAWAGWWWAIPRWGLPNLFERIYLALLHPARDSMSGWALDLMLNAAEGLSETVPLVLVGATLFTTLGALARIVARARLRAGYSDPLEDVRAWTARRAGATRALIWTPATVWLAAATAFMVFPYPRDFGGWSSVGAFLCLGVPLALGMGAATRVALRALLAPTLGHEEEKPVATVDLRVQFDAVAVTAETRAAVAAMAVLPVLTVIGIGAAGLKDAATMAALAGYTAVALAGAAVFRRASRVAVGVDGVFVTGSSRTRFLAYRDIDEAVARKGDLVLEKNGKVVLRLQLHGKDAACRDALLARLQQAVRAAHERAGAATAEVVASVSSSELARSAAGASDYRSPAVTREQLWGVVEGTEHDAATRTAAARALASTHDVEERGRLRVAAERCADPRLRVDLLELTEDSDDEIAVARPAGARLAR